MTSARIPPVAGTHLYTWVERDTLRIKCLAQEPNTVPLASSRTRTARKQCEMLDAFLGQLVTKRIIRWRRAFHHLSLKRLMFC